MNFPKNKTIGIFGLGKTGIACYEALFEDNNLICFDDNNTSKFLEQFPDATIGDLSDDIFEKLDSIIVSPGIPQEHQVFKLIKKHNVNLTSDIEILYKSNPEGFFITITGTNGKSTTASLIYHIAKSVAGFNAALCGNIGVPCLSLKKKYDIYIIELSSFQLETLKGVKADIAILLNITPHHLDRHENITKYINCKKRIFDNLKSNGVAIINTDCILSKKVYDEINIETKIPISPKTILEDESEIGFDEIKGADKTKLEYANKFLKVYQENFLSTLVPCEVMSITISEILEGFKSFQGLPHRMEFLGSYKGIDFYNDSKSTNTESTNKALKTLKNIYWIAGGVLTEKDLVLIDSMNLDNVTKVYLYGKAKIYIKKLLLRRNKNHSITIFNNLDQAFDKAYHDAKQDDQSNKTILLSPMCTSFDQFKNFEKRGEHFIKLFEKLENDQE